MANTAKRAHRRAVGAVANWKMVAFLEDDAEVVVTAPSNPVLVRKSAGDTYGLIIWPNGAETVLHDADIDMLDKHNGWVLTYFVRVRVEITGPGVWFETAVCPTAEMLSKRKGANEQWRPEGVGWKPIVDDDGATIWFRARTWEVYA